MASVPVVGTRWRAVDTGQVVEVERVVYSVGKWAVIARPVNGEPVKLPGGGDHLIAVAHWFTTEGYEHVQDAA